MPSRTGNIPFTSHKPVSGPSRVFGVDDRSKESLHLTSTAAVLENLHGIALGKPPRSGLLDLHIYGVRNE
jgi:hypothetical protein